MNIEPMPTGIDKANCMLFQEAEKLRREMMKVFEIPKSFLKRPSNVRTATEMVMMLEANNAKKR